MYVNVETWINCDFVLFVLVLPESRCLTFECGVKVQLSFAAEFSNIMIIYTRMLETPKDVMSCSAQLSDFTEVNSLYYQSKKSFIVLIASCPKMDYICPFQGPEVDLKHSNQESLDEAGSLLLTMDDLLPLLAVEQSQLFTRISALQRLQVLVL